MILLVGAAAVPDENDRIWTKANRFFELGDYYNAMQLYMDLYSSDSTDAELNYKLGVCHFEIKRFRDEAMPYFDHTSPAKYIEVDYYIGRLAHLNHDYQKAIEHYRLYKKSKGFKAYTNDEIDHFIDKSVNAIYFEANPDSSYQIHNLGDKINTKYPEYAPLLPEDESKLFFTARRPNKQWTTTDPFGDYFEDVYSSINNFERWETPVMLNTEVNTKMHDAGTGLSADGQKLLIFRTSEDLYTGNIYESSFNGDWSTPSKLGEIINSEDYVEASACYAPGGEIIFFSSDRPGGYGGKDLYVVKKLPTGEWGLPFNLGPSVNTPYDEDAPYVHPSGSILYFSSQGHRNMGGYDIFKSEFGESGKFTKAENLGYPINSADDDVFFVMNKDGSTAYLSSEREGGFGGQDLYVVRFDHYIPPLHVYHVQVVDENGIVLPDAEVILRSPESGKRIGKYKSQKTTGSLIILSIPDREYEFTVRASGHEPTTTTLVVGLDHQLSFTVTTKK